ncbi:MAG: EF-P beta-lysylation protein EpmB, partial [Thermoguttaceae bacterium]
NEINTELETAIAKIQDARIPVLVQSVLLRGINDSFETLYELYERLIMLRVMPYYLHQLDRVAGAAHFEVAPEKGRNLVEQLRKTLPGYAVPKYVREVPDQPYKKDV